MKKIEAIIKPFQVDARESGRSHHPIGSGLRGGDDRRLAHRGNA